MTVCNVKGITHSGENLRIIIILAVYLCFWSLLVYCGLLFWFLPHNSALTN